MHSGPRCEWGFGLLMNASGPAFCSPLNGVVGGLAMQPLASAALSNQKPTWNACVGFTEPGSKPKIWSSRMVLIFVVLVPVDPTETSDWYQASPKLPLKPGSKAEFCTVNMSNDEPGLKP